MTGKKIEEMTFEEKISWARGHIAISVGEGTFRQAVALVVDVVSQEAYRRGMAETEKAIKVNRAGLLAALESLTNAMSDTPAADNAANAIRFSRARTGPAKCPRCLHLPSARFATDGWRCSCRCHDAADLAPALTETALSLFALCVMPESCYTPEERSAKLERARAVIEAATGREP